MYPLHTGSVLLDVANAQRTELLAATHDRRRANLAHRFGTTRFVNILEHYAADHWLGVARTTDFKAAIEAAAAKHLPGLDMDAYWAQWRVN